MSQSTIIRSFENGKRVTRPCARHMDHYKTLHSVIFWLTTFWVYFYPENPGISNKQYHLCTSGQTVPDDGLVRIISCRQAHKNNAEKANRVWNFKREVTL